MKRLKAICIVSVSAAWLVGCGSGGGDREFDAESAPPTGETTAVDAIEALQVRIGTGNQITKIEGPDPEAAPVFNEVPYGVVVTDAEGNPVAGVTLKSFVFSQAYQTGTWFWDAASEPPVWRQNVVATCAGEDANENLLLDPGEDVNNDGQLTPGNVAAAFFGETGEALLAQTDDKGSAIMRVRYPRDRSEWVQVRVRVTATIPNGTEGKEERTFWLPMLSSDVTDAVVPPPGAVSPYGVGPCPVGAPA